MQHLSSNFILAIELTAFWLFVAGPFMAAIVPAPWPAGHVGNRARPPKHAHLEIMGGPVPPATST